MKVLKLFEGVCRRKQGFICKCGRKRELGEPIYIRFWKDDEGKDAILFCSKDCHDEFEAEYYKENGNWFDRCNP